MYEGLNFDFIVLPRNEPRISGGKKTYYIGDRVRVNCTSARSKPAAVLHWFINNKPVISYLFHVEYKFLLLHQNVEIGKHTYFKYDYQCFILFIFNIESRKHVYKNKSFFVFFSNFDQIRYHTRGIFKSVFMLLRCNYYGNRRHVSFKSIGINLFIFIDYRKFEF